MGLDRSLACSDTFSLVIAQIGDVDGWSRASITINIGPISQRVFTSAMNPEAIR